MEPIVAGSNWRRIDQAQKGIGPLLLRAGSGPQDPSYVGYQADDGRWLCGDVEVRPTHFCEIPQFDASDDEVAS
jgi:hypothetical protein